MNWKFKKFDKSIQDIKLESNSYVIVFINNNNSLIVNKQLTMWQPIKKSFKKSLLNNKKHEISW